MTAGTDEEVKLGYVEAKLVKHETYSGVEKRVSWW